VMFSCQSSSDEFHANHLAGEDDGGPAETLRAYQEFEAAPGQLYASRLPPSKQLCASAPVASGVAVHGERAHGVHRITGASRALELDPDGHTRTGKAAYHFENWGANGIPTEGGSGYGAVSLPPRPGEGLGLLEYSHYAGVPAAWGGSRPYHACGTLSAAFVPDHSDASPFAAGYHPGPGAGGDHLDELPYKLSGKYNVLFEQDNDPLIGAMSYD